MELNIEEQTLLATFRTLDERGRKELLRQASQLRKTEPAAAGSQAGQCRLERCEERPETAVEPIFTE